MSCLLLQELQQAYMLAQIPVFQSRVTELLPPRPPLNLAQLAYMGGTSCMGTTWSAWFRHLCHHLWSSIILVPLSFSGQVSELVKVSTMSSPKIVLAITDLSLPLGRRVAAKAIAAL